MTHSVPLLTSLIVLLPAVQRQDPARVAFARDTARSRDVATVDSARALRAARRAQQQFESTRRANLPFRPSAPSGPCDVQIGRICYWHEDGEQEKEAPEPAAITRARERLLSELADAAARLRGDDWIAGQRVRYLVDGRQDSAAVVAASECAGTPWWCAALAGLALHQAGRYARADSAFTAALAAMPEEQRCRWTDISFFLGGDVAKRYRRTPCAERDSVERRFWWLSQPLYSVEGNDARTEFFARRTMSRLEEDGRSASWSWGRDAEEVMMRFGWPTWWSRDHPSGYNAGPPPIVGHDPTPSFFVHPSDRLLGARPWEALAEDWEPRAKRPIARYAPKYAAGFADLPTQVAVFRRGDSALVVAAYELPRDSLFDGATTEAALGLGRDESAATLVVRDTGGSRDASPLVARAPRGPLLVSVELRAPRTRGVARARFGVPPRAGTGRLAVSDILLYEPGSGVVPSLDTILRRALRTPRASAGGRVGAYWEIYGVRPEGEPVAVTLTVERASVPWHTRAAERIGLATKVTPLKVRWQEVPSRDAGFASRAITVDLSSLPPGRYRMLLSVGAEDGSSSASERLLEIAGP